MNHVIESAETKNTAAKLLSGVTATSRRVWTGVLTSCAILASVVAPGCIVVDDDPDYYDPNEEVIIVDDDPVIESVPIDAGSGLSADPGEGAGVFVEFLGDGQWNVWLTCDTELTGRSCAYDIYATANGIVATGEDDLEADDGLYEDFNSLQLSADTTVDFDDMLFTTDPGEPVEIEVWLDGQLDGSLVFWVADGTILKGLPTNPTLFVP